MDSMDGMGRGGTGWDGMDGMGQDGTGWDGMEEIIGDEMGDKMGRDAVGWHAIEVGGIGWGYSWTGELGPDQDGTPRDGDGTARDTAR